MFFIHKILKNHTQNVAKILVTDPFIKNQNSAYFWINSLECYKVQVYQNILKLTCQPLAFTLTKAFFKKKIGPKLGSITHLLHNI